MLLVYLDRGDAYGLLARAARAAWGMEQLPPIARQAGGKPWFPSHPACCFSLSHSGGLALCALSDTPVGADLEVVRPRRAGLPAYVCRGAEYDRYLALGGDWPAFYALWTQRESVIKYTGEGLRAWRSAVVPDGCVLTRFRGEGWVACVCGREQAVPAPGQDLTPWRTD